MNLFLKIKKLLTRDFSNSTSEIVNAYGIFHYDKNNDKYKLVFMHKGLRIPIAIISFDIEKLKIIKDEIQSDNENYTLVIKQIKYFTLEEFGEP